MPHNNGISLPAHLAPLLQPTPSGVAKLVAAWDGLNSESQILILMRLDEVGLPAYLNEKVRIKALDSANAYIRYLAARRLYFGGDDTDEKKGVKRRIEEDSDPLVRYCLLEGWWGLLLGDPTEADAFFALPHEARLAKVRSLERMGEAMAKLVSYAVDHQLKDGTLSEIELFEILSDYVNKTEFKSHYDTYLSSYDGSIMWQRGKDIDDLWRLVPKVTESISHILIENLPRHAGLSTGIPEDVLRSMSDRQLTTLFNREDVGREHDILETDVRELRKKVFFDFQRGGEVRIAAIRYNFDLDYAEFAAILAKPKSERNTVLGELTFARSLSLCLYDAIHDALLDSDEGDPAEAEHAHIALERRLKQLKDRDRDKQLRELRLYRLAKQAVPWKTTEEGYPPSGELGFLSKSVVEGDIWRTFMSFSEAWAEDNWRTKKLEKQLPYIDEAGEDESSYETQVDDESAQEPTGIMHRIERKLTKIASALTRDPEDQPTKTEDRLSKLAREVTRLQTVQDRQSLLLYVVIGLLVWLLIKLF